MMHWNKVTYFYFHFIFNLSLVGSQFLVHTNVLKKEKKKRKEKEKVSKEDILSTLSFRCIAVRDGYIPAITLLCCRIMVSGTEEMKGFSAGSPAPNHWISFHTSGRKHYELCQANNPY